MWVYMNIHLSADNYTHLFPLCQGFFPHFSGRFHFQSFAQESSGDVFSFCAISPHE